MPSTAWPPGTNAANWPQDQRARLERSRSSRSVGGTRMSPYTFPCAHRLPRTHTPRHKSGVALACGLPFKVVFSTVLRRDPLEKIFSFFLSLSAIPRELIQHSDFLDLQIPLEGRAHLPQGFGHAYARGMQW